MKLRSQPYLLACLLAFACKSSSDEPAQAQAQPPQPAAQQPAPAPTPTPAAASAMTPQAKPTTATTFHSLQVKTLEGTPVSLAQYQGKVLLVVNTASECGYTPQYTGLQKLHEDYAAKGLVVLGFPSNDFGGQEPGSADEIRSFCTAKYAVTFPLFEKVVTKAEPDQSPVYAYLGGATGKLPSWNFCKYLVGQDGVPIAFYSSKTKPDDAELAAAIEKALAAR
jgi:glutathione peroxidase